MGGYVSVNETTNYTYDYNPEDYNYRYNYYSYSDEGGGLHVENVQDIIAAVILCIGSAFSALGVPANIINMVVFYRQGLLKDSCTASLINLSLSDFCVCVLGCFQLLSLSLQYYDESGYLECWNLIIPNLKQLFSQITCWITVFLSLERMISVTFPFKVKQLFSPKKSHFAIFVISIMCFILRSPIYLRSYCAYNKHIGKFHPFYIDEIVNIFDHIYVPLQLTNESIIRPLTVVLVLQFNIVIAVKVKISKRKRDKSLTNQVKGQKDEKLRQKAHASTQKETKLVMMMLVVSFVFLVCYSIHIFMGCIAIYLLVGPGHDDTFGMFFLLIVQSYLLMISNCLDNINSSVHIFVYYIMSTKYREEFRKMCSCLRVK